MKKAILRFAGVCLVLFGVVALANAQSMPSISGEPLSEEQMDPDLAKMNMNLGNEKAVESAKLNGALDDEKFAAWKASGYTYTDVDPNASSTTLSSESPMVVDEETLMQMSDADRVAYETMIEDMKNDGFLLIPGFTYTGDPLVDNPAYDEALAALLDNDALLKQLSIDNPDLFNEVINN